MQFADSDTQRLLRETARAYFRDRYPLERLFALERGDVALERSDIGEYAQLGWLGLLVPEEEGGAGASLLDAGVLVEEAGYAAVPSPLPQAFVASYVLRRAAALHEDLKEHLRRLARGDGFYGVAYTDYGWRPREGGDGGGLALRDGRLRGQLLLVPFAHVLDWVLAPISEDGSQALGLLPLAGARLEPQHLVDLRPVCRVLFDGLPLGGGAVIARGEEARGLREEMEALIAALANVEMAGIIHRVTAMTSEYISNRIQFGRPIATFQAARHRAAEMYAMAETVRWAAYHSLWEFERDPAASSDIWKAARWTAEAARSVFTNAHMLHGGIGVSLEHPLHLFTHVLMTLPVLEGSRDEMVRRITRALVPELS
ncbi:MAG: acyl-CoA/acyl-ACP dehydrogenase [Dehalococcoidia bacterium]|nr:acyl-CoA/acyl-ACP dehydrogenase [Dehalococcoidia bacterium]MDW8008950.1 acyl-CoA dehydrogenase family protein [Chloroflexota bacterium]